MPSKNYLDKAGLEYLWSKILGIASEVAQYSTSYTDDEIENIHKIVNIFGTVGEEEYVPDEDWIGDASHFLCRRYFVHSDDGVTPYGSNEILALLRSDDEIRFTFEHPNYRADVIMRLYRGEGVLGTPTFISPTEEGCYYAYYRNGSSTNAYIDIYYRKYVDVATLSEIEEVCTALGMTSVVIGTDDYTVEDL